MRDDFCRNIVIRIFKDYLSGKGQTRIANELTSEGIPTPAQVAGKANAATVWHDSTIKIILHNRHYLGHLVQGRETTVSVTSKARQKISPDNYVVIENTHEAIIDEELFYSVQDRLKKRSKRAPGARSHLFSGILVCADCGKGFHYRANSKGYVCGAYDRRGNNACSSHLVREQALLEFVINDINHFIKQVSNPTHLQQSKDTLFTSAQKLNEQIETCHAEIEKLNEQKNKALSHLINDVISKEEYQSFTQGISSQIQSLKDQLLEYEKSLSGLSKDNYLKEIKKISSFGTITELNLEIIQQFVNEIVIDKDGKATIHYRFTISSLTN